MNIAARRLKAIPIQTDPLPRAPGTGKSFDMLTHFFKAAGQLSDPRMRGVLWQGIAGALAVFVALWAVVWWLLANVDPASIWGIATIVEWMGDSFDWIAGIAFFAAMLVATFMLFPAVVTMVFGLFLDRVAGIVEERHYPGLAAPRAQPLLETLVGTVKFAAIVVLLNLLFLPLYVLLIFLPGANLLLYYLLNGYLIGREFFELAAFRRMEPAEAHRLRRAWRGKVMTAGVLMTFLMTIPVANLLAPVLGAAFMVHVFHDLRRREAGKAA